MSHVILLLQTFFQKYSILKKGCVFPVLYNKGPCLPIDLFPNSNPSSKSPSSYTWNRVYHLSSLFSPVEENVITAYAWFLCKTLPQIFLCSRCSQAKWQRIKKWNRKTAVRTFWNKKKKSERNHVLYEYDIPPQKEQLPVHIQHLESWIDFNQPHSKWQ